ncbi:MAG TPA: hypothetical protein VLV16_02745 [Gemmatimonadales bacterium]|nr:hypothetical protein [Gemmatimonadales bacterium]
MDSRHEPFDERSLRVVHAVAGRLRFRGPAGVVSEDLAQAIRDLGGVRSCNWSARTGSMLVTFEPEKITAGAIAEAVARHADLDDSLLAGPVPELQPRGPAGGASFAAGIADTFAEVDRRVHSATRGLFRLGTLVPLGLAVWASREIMLGRAAPLAWSTALWYAHGLFRDYNSPSAS